MNRESRIIGIGRHIQNAAKSKKNRKGEKK